MVTIYLECDLDLHLIFIKGLNFSEFKSEFSYLKEDDPLMILFLLDFSNYYPLIN